MKTEDLNTPVYMPANIKKLEQIIYLPGAYSSLLKDFRIQEFMKALDEDSLSKDNNKVKWFYKEYRDSPIFKTKHEFFSENTLPFPDWVKTFQYGILKKVYQNDLIKNWSIGFLVSGDANATLGAHFDNDDVFTIQLSGQKKWFIDAVDMPRFQHLVAKGIATPISNRINFSSSETWIVPKNADIKFTSPTEIIMNPGDFLAMPAYALHKVITTTNSPTLSVNVSVTQFEI